MHFMQFDLAHARRDALLNRGANIASELRIKGAESQHNYDTAIVSYAIF
jgi:hypothetical protein